LPKTALKLFLRLVAEIMELCKQNEVALVVQGGTKLPYNAQMPQYSGAVNCSVNEHAVPGF